MLHGIFGSVIAFLFRLFKLSYGIVVDKLGIIQRLLPLRHRHLHTLSGNPTPLRIELLLHHQHRSNGIKTSVIVTSVSRTKKAFGRNELERACVLATVERVRAILNHSKVVVVVRKLNV